MSSRRSRALAPIPVALDSRYENHGNLREGSLCITSQGIALGDCKPLKEDYPVWSLGLYWMLGLQTKHLGSRVPRLIRLKAACLGEEKTFWPEGMGVTQVLRESWCNQRCLAFKQGKCRMRGSSNQRPPQCNRHQRPWQHILRRRGKESYIQGRTEMSITPDPCFSNYIWSVWRPSIWNLNCFCWEKVVGNNKFV